MKLHEDKNFCAFYVLSCPSCLNSLVHMRDFGKYLSDWYHSLVHVERCLAISKVSQEWCWCSVVSDPQILIHKLDTSEFF
jgi:hypothetical protein